MFITRSKIKAIGKKLRLLEQGQTLSSKDLNDLTAWRDSHGPSLNYLVKTISTLLNKNGVKSNHYFLGQRLKRIYSIKLKLIRFQNMQLSMMDDIAGVRVVLKDLKEVSALFNSLKEKKFQYDLLRVNNYVSAPKEDGYRSIHMVYRTSNDPSVQIEIQLRTHLQHVWATAVEVFGTIIQTSFKTGEGEEEWRIFFKLLSSRFALAEQANILPEHEAISISKLNKELIAYIKKLNIIEQLNAYTSVYESDWTENRNRGRTGKYALLILNNITNKTEVEFYSEKNRMEGLKRYSKLEKDHLSDEKVNTVFISVDNMNKLVEAYPNYFMDTKTLTNYLSRIVLRDF